MQHRPLLDASPQLQDLLLEFLLREVRDLQANHDRPTRGCRADVRRRVSLCLHGSEMPEQVAILMCIEEYFI